MIQEVIVKANAHEALRPLVQAAIRNQLKILQQGIDHSRERIAEFEKITGMSSAEFEKKLLEREIEDTLDVLDWNMELASMRLLERQYKYLDEAEVR
ncbi:MAG: hypothetical protein IPL71_22145 [Anaerolineales bacterium]|uniref:hypothetical protein n=1 Tax=Candidatus Villigracilis proximus TaxID=3140683 RepID=UPI003134AFC3|nr:hypothetical protein [Anaerolineales bacterium]